MAALKKPFSTMWAASAANSSDLPSRRGLAKNWICPAAVASGHVQDRRVEAARDDRVDTDAATGKLARRRQRHADESRLGGGVAEHAGGAVLTGD